MSCFTKFKNNLQFRLRSGILPSFADKSLLIAYVFDEHKEKMFNAIQILDDRVSVFKNKDIFTLTEATKDKLEDELNIRETRDTIIESSTGKAFYGENDKHKVPVTPQVNAIISSIPHMNEVHQLDNNHGQRLYTYHTTLPITQTRQLLYRLYTRHGTIENSENLQEILRLGLSSNTLSDTDRRIAYSLYNFLYSKATLNYKNEIGENIKMKSLTTIRDTTQDTEIQTRVSNYLSIFQIAIVSVNEFSTLLILSSDGNETRSKSQTQLVRMMNVNTVQVNNLFETNDDDPKLTSFRLKEKIVQDFIEKEISVVQDSKYTYSTTMNINGTQLSVPFELTNDKAAIVKVSGLVNYYKSKIKNELLSTYGDENIRRFNNGEPQIEDGEISAIIEKETSNFLNSTIRNVDFIFNILQTLGYKDIVDRKMIENIIQAKDSNLVDRENKTNYNIDRLWQLINGGIVSLSVNITQTEAFNKYNYSPIDNYHRYLFNQTFENAFQNTAEAENPRNLLKTISKSSLVEAGLDTKKIVSFVTSPLMFFTNQDWLASKIIENKSLFAKNSQHNAEDSNVDTDNNSSRAENINKIVVEIAEDENLENSIFKDNAFVTKELYIEEVVKVDGYKGDDGKGKSHMDMNENEIAAMTLTSFSNELFKGFDKMKGAFRTILAIPQVFSDKSFWGGFTIRNPLGNFLPLTSNGKANIELLLKKEVKNQTSLDNAFTKNFLREWGKAYWVGLDGYQHMMFPSGIDVDKAMQDSVEFERIITAIHTIVPKGVPISLTENKYYNLEKEENGNTRIIIKDILFDKLIRPFQITGMSDQEIVNLRSGEILESLALNHNHFKDDFNADLNGRSKANTVIEDKFTEILKNSPLLKDLPYKKGSSFSIDMKEFNKLDINFKITLLSEIHPIEIAQFFAHNNTYNHINDLLLGSKYQYTNNSVDSMLGAMLKRSVASGSPGVPMDLDNVSPEKRRVGDGRMTSISPVVFIDDEEVASMILGTGTEESVKSFDGACMTTDIAEGLYQISFGGVNGLRPNSSLKFFYANTDIKNADMSLIKYAGYVISEEFLDVGTLKLWDYYKLQLDSIPLGRETLFPSIMYGDEEIIKSKTFGANESLFDIYMYIKDTKDTLNDSRNISVRLKTATVIIDLLKQNPDLKDKFLHKVVIKSSNKTGQKLYHKFENLQARLRKGERVNSHELGTLRNKDLVQQLDATHGVENSLVSKFSQAITNSIQEGREFPQADKLLKTLAKLIDLNLDSVKKIFTNGKIDFENEFTLGQFELRTHPEFIEFYKEGLYKNDNSRDEAIKFKISNFGKESIIRLFIRANVMGSMAAQQNINSTYMQMQSDVFSLQAPMTGSLVESAVRSYINKKTNAMKFPGGNSILAPSHGLIAVYDIEKDGVRQTIIGAKNLQRILDKNEGWVQVGSEHRDLKWSGITDEGGNSFLKEKVFTDFSASSKKIKALRKDKKTKAGVTQEMLQENLNLKAEVQKELERKVNGKNKWAVHPAEVVMPFSYKKKFDLYVGMQPQDITVDYYVKIELAKNTLSEYYDDWVNMEVQDRDAFAEKAVKFFTDMRYKLNKSTPRVNQFENVKHAYENIIEVLKLSRLNSFSISEFSERTGIPEENVLRVIEEFQLQRRSSRKTLELNELQRKEETALIESQKRYDGFQKALSVMVGRIPSTGLQSAVMGKIIGFVESNNNTIWFPVELMMIQGADLDIDKAVILSWNFDNRGHYILDDSVKGLQNQVTQLLSEISLAPSTQVASNSPVNMDELAEERDTRITPENKFIFDDKQPATMVKHKVSASEGKSMVGVVMNLYKTYNLTYYTHMKNLKNGVSNTVIPLEFFDGKKMVRRESLGNIDPTKAEKQMWEMFSALGNASTDNAKEMILGPIGANLQTGNLIGLLTAYGVQTKDIFDFLTLPEVKKVLKEVRNSNNITSDYKISTTIENVAAKFLKKGGLKPNSEKIYKFLIKLAQSSEEMSILAGGLGINRELPLNAFEMFNYSQKIENYINRKIEKYNLEADVKINTVFNFKKFMDNRPENKSYKEAQKQIYSQIQLSFNILKVIDETPDINAYIQASLYTTDVLKELNDKNVIVESVITTFKKLYPDNKYNNITEIEYKGIVRHLEELVITDYLQKSGHFEELSTYHNGEKLTFKIDKLEELAKFQILMVDFILEVRGRNEDRHFVKNVFFDSLQRGSDKNGEYLRIPNIEGMSKITQFGLQASLNNFTTAIKYHGGVIPNQEFRKMLYAYAVINSKGKISTTSFFDMFNENFSEPFGYIRYLNENPNVLTNIEITEDYIKHSPTINTALSSLLPRHSSKNEYLLGTKEEDEYSGETYNVIKNTYDANTKLENLPAYIQHKISGVVKTFKLISTKEGFKYSISRNKYKPTTLSTSLTNMNTHTTEYETYKNITDGATIAALHTQNGNKNVPLSVKTDIIGIQPVATSVGDITYDSVHKSATKPC